MKVIFFLLALILPTLTFADSTYDWQTGNQYNTTKDSQGNTNVQGYNFNTGSSWNTRIQSNGDMSGTDAQGNYWTYNNRSGSYYNSGTGESCYGKGAARSCY